MKTVKALVGAVLLAALPLAAQADDMSYSYVDLAYADANLDIAPGFDADGDGFALRGSVGFAENFFAFADYASYDFPASVDVDLYNIGLGGRLGISDNVDLVGRVGYAHSKADAPGAPSFTDSGYMVSAGIRGRVAEGFELEGSVIYTDFGDPGPESPRNDDTALAVGGRYFFTPQFAVGAEYQASDDVDQWFAGVRFAF